MDIKKTDFYDKLFKPCKKELQLKFENNLYYEIENDIIKLYEINKKCPELSIDVKKIIKNYNINTQNIPKFSNTIHELLIIIQHINTICYEIKYFSKKYPNTLKRYYDATIYWITIQQIKNICDTIKYFIKKHPMYPDMYDLLNNNDSDTSKMYLTLESMYDEIINKISTIYYRLEDLNKLKK